MEAYVRIGYSSSWLTLQPTRQFTAWQAGNPSGAPASAESVGTTSYNVDCATGLLAASTNANGRTNTFLDDLLDRVTSRTQKRDAGLQAVGICDAGGRG